MDSTTKTYPIKVPVYVSEKIERDDNGSLFATNVADLINNAKSLINKYTSSTITLLDKRKTATIGIKSIMAEDISFNSDQCLLLRVSAFKSNLTDGYYQQANDTENTIRFNEKDKICSDTYCFILYPFLTMQSDTNAKYDIYWHVFLYDDPSKANNEMIKIARSIMKSVLNTPIKNIKSDKFMADIKRYKFINSVEIELSTITDDDEGVPKYIQKYNFKSIIKKGKKITLSNMSSDDAVCALQDDSFLKNYSKRQFKFITHNKRIFNIIQEYKDKLSEAIEESFNYTINVNEEDIKSGKIFETDTIKRNVEGIFTEYMANYSDE